MKKRPEGRFSADHLRMRAFVVAVQLLAHADKSLMSLVTVCMSVLLHGQPVPTKHATEDGRKPRASRNALPAPAAIA